MSIELERKWLVKDFPEGVRPVEAYKIYQSYLIAGEEEARLRRAVPEVGYPGRMSAYKLTFKGPGTSSRKEVEIELMQSQYFLLLDFVKDGAQPIIKEYRKYQVGDRIVEISKVDDDWFYAEVEFPSSSTSNFLAYEFPWPELVIKDVTTDTDYKMKNYWLRTREV